MSRYCVPALGHQRTEGRGYGSDPQPVRGLSTTCDDTRRLAPAHSGRCVPAPALPAPPSPPLPTINRPPLPPTTSTSASTSASAVDTTTPRPGRTSCRSPPEAAASASRVGSLGERFAHRQLRGSHGHADGGAEHACMQLACSVQCSCSCHTLMEACWACIACSDSSACVHGAVAEDCLRGQTRRVAMPVVP